MQVCQTEVPSTLGVPLESSWLLNSSEAGFTSFIGSWMRMEQVIQSIDTKAEASYVPGGDLFDDNNRRRELPQNLWVVVL